jgi:dTDP-4-amino-4,6-dideoxygalactose transaminase
LTASFGLAQLERFPGLTKKRMNTIATYDEALLPMGVVRLEHNGNDYQGNGHLYLARIPGINEQQRNEIIAEMASRGVACNVHFKPLPMFTAYQRLGFDIANFPNAYAQYRNEITLPTHTLLTEKDIAFVVKNFISVISPYLS